MPGSPPAHGEGPVAPPATAPGRRLLDSWRRETGEPGATAASAVRVFPEDEPFFAGHFPELPVVPGVFLVEALAECARRLLGAHPDGAGREWRLVEVDRVRFRRRVSPGDRLELRVVRQDGPDEQPRFQGEAQVGAQRVVEVAFTLG